MKVFLSRRAVKSYTRIRDYIEEEWGESVAESFEVKVNDLFTLLANYPEMGILEQKDIRSFQLTQQTRVFYRIKGNRLVILSLFDVRQDPKKKPM
ncbi:type II toxin-antitoxin system RelE/ParE family toxin [Chryseolinea sp. T2]|uniref:type II toxin-antitoxin system RelE/ParE family toxin n=1 Tax=Chryseolinea sp. T2 TaxID=3129255 RepID=UPI003078095A